MYDLYALNRYGFSYIKCIYQIGLIVTILSIVINAIIVDAMMILYVIIDWNRNGLISIALFNTHIPYYLTYV